MKAGYYLPKHVHINSPIFFILLLLQDLNLGNFTFYFISIFLPNTRAPDTGGRCTTKQHGIVTKISNFIFSSKYFASNRWNNIALRSYTFLNFINQCLYVKKMFSYSTFIQLCNS